MVHEMNIPTLAIEVFKVVDGLSPKIMNSVFPINFPHIVQNKYF